MKFDLVVRVDASQPVTFQWNGQTCQGLAGDTLAAATTAALAHGATMPAAVEFGKAWVTEGLRWAYPLGAGHGPVNPLWAVATPD